MYIPFILWILSVFCFQPAIDRIDRIYKIVVARPRRMCEDGDE